MVLHALPHSPGYLIPDITTWSSRVNLKVERQVAKNARVLLKRWNSHMGQGSRANPLTQAGPKLAVILRQVRLWPDAKCRDAM